MHAVNHKLLARPTERGFTLIEIMIALLIGLFLMGALLTIVQSNRRVYGEQSQLAQMQDNQRMAMTMMADVIQSAGYFPDPHNNTLKGTLILSGSFAQGQSIYGTSSAAAAPWDQIQVRYMTAPQDGILNCSGQQNGNPVGGANILYTNWFKVVNGQLVCRLISTNGTTDYVLVGGVTGSRLDITKMIVLYGVATAPGNNVDTYMTADQVTAAVLWNSVISVSVTLTFTNPLYAAGNGQQATFDIQRIISVMSQTGPVL
jgi:type IV pilus assembly protein PilW